MGTTDDDSVAGALGIPQLRDVWSSWARRSAGARSAQDWARNCLVIHGLGIGLEQVARFMSKDRSFDEFETWIAELNGGAVDPTRVARINRALSGAEYDALTRRRLAGIEAMPAVLDDADLRHWQEQGYVVLRDAITPEEQAAAVDAICRYIGVDPDEPATWPARKHCQGIMVQFFQHASLEAARGSPRIHKAYSQLWGHADLLPTTDRCGFNPPEGSGFRFPGPHLHWDADLTPPLGQGIQGIVYLADTAPEQGAFCCVPGFHRDIDAWLRALPATVNPYDRIPHAAAIPVAGRAGDMVIWHHGLPHGSSPNRAARPRFAQYLTFFPARVMEPHVA